MTHQAVNAHALAPYRLSACRTWRDWRDTWADPWLSYEARMGLLLNGYDCRNVDQEAYAERFRLYLKVSDGYRRPIMGSGYTASEAARVEAHAADPATLEQARQLLALTGVKELLAHELNSAVTEDVLSASAERLRALLESPDVLRTLLWFFRPTRFFNELFNVALSAADESLLRKYERESLGMVIDKIIDYLWGVPSEASKGIRTATKRLFMSTWPQLTEIVAGRGRLLSTLTDHRYRVTPEVMAALKAIILGQEQRLSFTPEEDDHQVLSALPRLRGVRLQAALVIVARSQHTNVHDPQA